MKRVVLFLSAVMLLASLMVPAVAASAASSVESKVVETAEAVEPYVSPIDFAALQAVNPEIYAWLYIPNMNINYPLLQHAGDDNYYLTHDSKGNYYSGGAIFTQQTYNGTDFTDPVTVAYAHRTAALFGQLQPTYSDPSKMENRSEIVVYLPERELHYTIFAAVPYANRHILYSYDFSNERMYGAFLRSVYSVKEAGAVFNDKVTATTDDQLLILSTCLYGNSQKRYLVLAKCVEDINTNPGNIN